MFGYHDSGWIEHDFYRAIRDSDWQIAETALGLMKEIATSTTQPEMAAIINEQLAVMEKRWYKLNPYKGIGGEMKDCSYQPKSLQDYNKNIVDPKAKKEPVVVVILEEKKKR